MLFSAPFTLPMARQAAVDSVVMRLCAGASVVFQLSDRVLYVIKY